MSLVLLYAKGNLRKEENCILETVSQCWIPKTIIQANRHLGVEDIKDFVCCLYNNTTYDILAQTMTKHLKSTLIH